ncbi:unnamed protein product [Nippostrongylus brasiliensis]|uniref:Chromate transporter n=1 Tax=Nippostrongylus brasiliensis TaxID=27835 RepID=A0A0N4YR53_NIPBR|nr:unnamed protein product [Nippostrongylus brasiliensis]
MLKWNRVSPNRVISDDKTIENRREIRAVENRSPTFSERCPSIRSVCFGARVQRLFTRTLNWTGGGLPGGPMLAIYGHNWFGRLLTIGGALCQAGTIVCFSGWLVTR